MEQERLKEEEEARRTKKENTKGKQQAVERDETKSKTLSTDPKSRAGTADSPARSPTESGSDTAPPVVYSLELHPTEEPNTVKENTHRKSRWSD